MTDMYMQDACCLSKNFLHYDLSVYMMIYDIHVHMDIYIYIYIAHLPPNLCFDIAVRETRQTQQKHLRAILSDLARLVFTYPVTSQPMHKHTCGIQCL